MEQIKDTLPDKLSALIRVAVGDMRKAQAMPEVYKIVMNHWHDPINGKCQVCMAGSALAFSVGISPNISTPWVDIPRSLDRKTEALNCVRNGYISEALEFIGVDYEEAKEWQDRDVADWDTSNSEPFYSDMEIIAAELEAAGL